jgi:hypothetical protein
MCARSVPDVRRSSAHGPDHRIGHLSHASHHGPRTATPIAWSGLLRLLTAVGSPIALTTALLFYFGWVRTKVQSERLGFDSSLLDLSIQDYVLKSINVLSVPVLVLLLLAIFLHFLHRRLVVPAVERRCQQQKTPLALRLLHLSWALWFPAGVAVALSLPPLRGFAAPMALTLALLCSLYAQALLRRLGRPDPPTVVHLLLLATLAFALFWDTERVARTMGEAYATQIAAQPEDLVVVTVYSTKSLDLRVPGVIESKSDAADSMYPYCYTGLRLLQRSGDRYFLITDGWDLDHRRVLLLRESDAVRLEFSR